MRPQKSHIRHRMARNRFILHLGPRFQQRMWSIERRAHRCLRALARPGTQYRLALLLAALLSLVCGWALFVWMLSHSASLVLAQGLL
jgi:hypothetical protein